MQRRGDLYLATKPAWMTSRREWEAARAAKAADETRLQSGVPSLAALAAEAVRVARVAELAELAATRDARAESPRTPRGASGKRTRDDADDERDDAEFREARDHALARQTAEWEFAMGGLVGDHAPLCAEHSCRRDASGTPPRTCRVCVARGRAVCASCCWLLNRPCNGRGCPGGTVDGLAGCFVCPTHRANLARGAERPGTSFACSMAAANDKDAAAEAAVAEGAAADGSDAADRSFWGAASHTYFNELPAVEPPDHDGGPAWRRMRWLHRHDSDYF